MDKNKGINVRNKKMNNMSAEYYKKFPKILQNSLIKKQVQFPEDLITEYDDMEVYRGIKYNNNKKDITLEDFSSHIERAMKNPSIAVDKNKIEYYACSCFQNFDYLKKYGNFPRKNYAIAKGILKMEYGPITQNKNTSHINLFLFKNVDPSKNFKVVE